MQNKELLIKKLRLNSNATDQEIYVAYTKLKNTYELVIVRTNDSDVKAMAEQKLRELEGLYDAGLGKVSFDISGDDGYDEIVKASYKLFSNGRAGEKECRIMIDKLKNTTMTSENYYLQAMLHLEINNGYPGCGEAKEAIENALTIEPGNEAYLALKKGIDSVIKAKIDHDEHQRRIKEEELRQQQEREAQLRKEEERERRRVLCGNICECMCECFGGLVQCICSCCSCCDDCY